MGADGISITNNDEIIPAIIKAKKSNKPFIINALVESGELSLPPHISFKQAKNFGISKIKELIKVAKGNKDQWQNIKSEITSFIDRES